MVLAADRRQTCVVSRYINRLLGGVTIMARLIESRIAETVHLANRVLIEVRTAEDAERLNAASRQQTRDRRRRSYQPEDPLSRWNDPSGQKNSRSSGTRPQKISPRIGNQTRRVGR
jgi:hypothetical protein